MYKDTLLQDFGLTIPASQVTIHYAKPEIRKELIDKCILRFRPLLELLQNGWIAGGAVRDFFANANTNKDIDVFFQSEKDLICSDLRMREKHKVLYENPGIIAYAWKGKIVQFIRTHYFKDANETISHFDFTVACAAVDLNGVYVHDMFFQDLAGRRLAINSLPFPLATLERLQKYVKKGYTACNGTLLEIAKGIQGVPIESNENSLAFYPDGSPRFVRFD